MKSAIMEIMMGVPVYEKLQNFGKEYDKKLQEALEKEKEILQKINNDELLSEMFFELDVLNGELKDIMCDCYYLEGFKFGARLGIEIMENIN